MFTAAVSALLSGCVLAVAVPAGAADVGGTPAAPGSTGGTSKKPSTAPRTPAAAPVRITSVSCVPAAHCSANPHQVSLHGTLLLKGGGLKAGMTVVFPKSPGARISRTSPSSRLRQTSLGLVVTVPASAHSGRIMVLINASHHTGSVGPITVFNHALHPPPAKSSRRRATRRPRGRRSKARACGSGT